MTTKLNELMQELSPVQRKAVRQRAREHVKAMALASKLSELRWAVEKNQTDIAAAMGIGQNAVSQMEKRGDIQLSTLNRYVQSLGFELELAVVASDGARVVLEHFKPWKVHASRPPKSRRVAAQALVKSSAKSATDKTSVVTKKRTTSHRPGAIR
jgi:DNA-binding Xre family transcriptional regulator